MSKLQYRSEIGIISDVLCVAMDSGIHGTIISTISRRANLSYYAAMEKCQKLVDRGLMETIIDKKNRIFIITEKGIELFHHMEKFLETIHEIKIRI